VVHWPTDVVYVRYIFCKHLDGAFDRYIYLSIYLYIYGYTFWDLSNVYMCFLFLLMMSNYMLWQIIDV
jgi:hypothetical protein